MSNRIYRGAAVVILLAIAGQQYLFGRKSLRADEYQRRIREAAESAPMRVGAWVGQDVPVPLQAITKLKPDLIISRQFINVADGSTAGLLLEHCSDAHDMAGHFPPHCFPANGWTIGTSLPRDWIVDDLKITGMEYSFSMYDQRMGTERTTIVINCLLGPDGVTLRDMEGMARSVALTGTEGAGAGQLQLFFDARMPATKRDAAAAELIRGYRKVIDAILAKI